MVLDTASDETAAADTAAADLASQSDDALLLAYGAGDQASFAELYRRYRGPVYRYFIRQVGAAAAEDLFQDTWMKLLNGASGYRAQGRFAAYLFKLAHNVLMDFFRRESTRAAEPEDSATVAETLSGEALEASLSRDQLKDRLYEEIARLPVAQRSVWLIRQESGLDLASIAKMTASTVETVKSRLRYANDKLKAGMQRHVRS